MTIESWKMLHEAPGAARLRSVGGGLTGRLHSSSGRRLGAGAEVGLRLGPAQAHDGVVVGARGFLLGVKVADVLHLRQSSGGLRLGPGASAHASHCFNCQGKGFTEAAVSSCSMYVHVC